MFSFTDPFGDLQFWENTHRARLTPEQRAREDRAAAWRSTREILGAIFGIASIAAILLVPWIVGAIAIWRVL